MIKHERSLSNKNLRAGGVGEGLVYPTRSAMLDNFRASRSEAKKDTRRDAIECGREGGYPPYSKVVSRGVRIFFEVDGDCYTTGAEPIDWELNSTMTQYSKKIADMIEEFGDRLTEVSLDEQFDMYATKAGYEDGDYNISDYAAGVVVWKR